MIKWIILLLVICLLLVIEWMREIRTFQVTHYRIDSKKLSGLKTEKKIVFLSDLHNCSYGNDNDKLFETVKDQKPDYIMVAGDMIVGKPEEPTAIAESIMCRLPEICPVFYANGNHEQRAKEKPELYGDMYDKYRDRLEKAGVVFLSNETRKLDWDGITTFVYGLELPHCKYKKFKRHSLNMNEMNGLLGDFSENDYGILIAHNPVFMNSYLEWGADLVLSGHFHGGVLRLPGIGGVITPQFTLFPKYSGEMKKVGDATVVVSKGIGIHTIKVRLFNPAEVIVMHINGTED